MHESFFDQKKKHINNILLKNWKLNGKHLQQKGAKMENLPRRSLRASETHLVLRNKKMI